MFFFILSLINDNDVIHGMLRTTNCLERLNQEIRILEEVIMIFPNKESEFRLIFIP